VPKKAGDMLWKAWLNVEMTLVNEYMAYLVRFADDESVLERSRKALEEARQRWITIEIERRFKNLKAFKRCVARSTWEYATRAMCKQLWNFLRVHSSAWMQFLVIAH
jgi:hypothetical protein